jgi:hypothetical protein
VSATTYSATGPTETLSALPHPAQAASCVECCQDIPFGPLCDGCSMVESRGPHRYQVAYYDAKLSRVGKGGSRVRKFTLRSAAEDFASRNRIYSKPSKVEVLP